MAGILEKYGIKEVADVVFYKIGPSGEALEPVLVLDTLKVSTIEQTAEEVYAQGGKGNPRLIGWDMGKEITVTLEDALFSPKSMSIMFGNEGDVATTSSTTGTVLKTIAFTADGTVVPTTVYDANGNAFNVSDNSGVVYDANGSSTTTLVAGERYYVKMAYKAATEKIEVNANTFPGTYYVVGDTYARAEVNGEDDFFQFVIPKAKVSSENTITLETDGEPTVFSMNLTVLRPGGGKPMMELIKYTAGS